MDLPPELCYKILFYVEDHNTFYNLSLTNSKFGNISIKYKHIFKLQLDNRLRRIELSTSLALLFATFALHVPNNYYSKEEAIDILKHNKIPELIDSINLPNISRHSQDIKRWKKSLLKDLNTSDGKQ